MKNAGEINNWQFQLFCRCIRACIEADMRGSLPPSKLPLMSSYGGLTWGGPIPPQNVGLRIPDQKSSWNKSIWRLQSWKVTYPAPFLISCRSKIVSGWIYDTKSTFLVKKYAFLTKKLFFWKIQKNGPKFGRGVRGAEPPGNWMALVKKNPSFCLSMILDAKKVIFHEMAPYASYKAQIWLNNIYIYIYIYWSMLNTFW